MLTQAALAQHPHNLQVFVYGSLLWHPGFEFRSAQIAHLKGFQRKACIASLHYRGSLEHPGLVLGLVPGGDCWGMVFEAPQVSATVAYLWQREMITNVYQPSWVQVSASQENLSAVTFIADPNHSQYCPDLTFEQIILRVARAKGPKGTNRDYFINTAHQLKQLQISDPYIERIADALQNHSQSTQEPPI